MPEERPYRTGRERRPKAGGHLSASGFRVVAVQSISCAVVLLIVLIMRLVGGDAFGQLRESFNAAIMENTFASTIASLFAGGDASGTESSDSSGSPTDPSSDAGGSETSAPDTSTTQPIAGSESTVPGMGGQDIDVRERKVLYAPEGATFVPLKSNRLASAPLSEGTISSYFGYRENPTKGGLSFHQGVDIAAPEGAPVSAMFYGVVTAAGTSSSYGNYVRISHGNGMEILYAHCSEVLVQKDTVIRAGETVAKVGSTGDSTGSHLHVEVKVDGIAYDPLPLLPADAY